MTRNALFTGAAVLLMAVTIGFFALRGGPSAFPKDFPHTWLPAGKATNDPADVQVVRSGSPTQTFDAQAAVLHAAYVCDDPACPGRDASGRPVIFPYEVVGDNVAVFRECPAYLKARGKHPAAPASQDAGPTIHAYLTPEGEQAMKRFLSSR